MIPILEAIKGIKELADMADIKITELSLDTPSFCKLDTEVQQLEERKYFEKPNVYEIVTVYGLNVKCREVL